MKLYYFNPVGQDLIVFDSESGEMQIVERIQTVRVWVDGEVKLMSVGVDAEPPQGESVGSRRRRVSQCSKCGKGGHRSDSPAFHLEA